MKKHDANFLDCLFLHSASSLKISLMAGGKDLSKTFLVGFRLVNFVLFNLSTITHRLFNRELLMVLLF